jgi:hypothetical protein
MERLVGMARMCKVAVVLAVLGSLVGIGVGVARTNLGGSALACSGTPDCNGGPPPAAGMVP